MRLFRPKEWLATIGSDALLSLGIFYVFSFSSALELDSVHRVAVRMFAAGLRNACVLLVAVVTGYRLRQFRLDAGELLLPSYRSVLFAALHGS